MSTTRHRPATGDENIYGTGRSTNSKGSAAAAGPPTKPGVSSSSSSTIGPSGLTGGKTVARKALGALMPSFSVQTEGQEEDQALIKQGLGNKGPRPRRALGEITNRVGAGKSRSSTFSSSTKSSSSSSSSYAKSTIKSSLSALSSSSVAAPPSLPPSLLADLPSFSDDEDEEDEWEVERAAGRLGEEEDKLVAIKRATKEKEGEAAFLRELEGGRRRRVEEDRAQEQEQKEEEEFERQLQGLLLQDIQTLMTSAALVEEEIEEGREGRSEGVDVTSLGPAVDDLDLLEDF